MAGFTAFQFEFALCLECRAVVGGTVTTNRFDGKTENDLPRLTKTGRRE